MTPTNLITRIDGLLGTGIRAARAPQRVVQWRLALRTVIFSPSLRDATDWELTADDDIVNAASSIDSSGGTVYAVLVDSIYDVSGEHLVMLLANTTGQTLDAPAFTDLGGAVIGADSEGALIWKVAPAADTSNAVFWTGIWPDGRVFADQIEAMADGEEGTAPTANDVRLYVVYRSDTETQV